MEEYNKTSRRSFVKKMAALGLLSTGIPAIAGAGILHSKDREPGFDKAWIPEDFVSNKKFVPVMLTPYRHDGQIDFDMLSRLMDFYIAAGVKGFFANCQSSEMYKLSPDERLGLANHVVKRVNGKMSVVAAGSFGDSLEDKAEFTKKMYHTGVNAVITITSLIAKQDESDEVLIKNYEKFFSLTDNIPLGTYECPAPYKRILTPEVFKYLLSTGRMIYHKDTTIDFPRVKVKIELAKNNKLEFYDACVANTMFSLQAGARGMSAISGNFYPEILVWMCNNSTNPDKQEDVKYIQAQLTKTEDIIAQYYPLSAKYFLHKRGLPIEISSRLNPDPLTDQQMQALDNVYTVLQGWCDRIGVRLVKM